MAWSLHRRATNSRSVDGGRVTRRLAAARPPSPPGQVRSAGRARSSGDRAVAFEATCRRFESCRAHVSGGSTYFSTTGSPCQGQGGARTGAALGTRRVAAAGGAARSGGDAGAAGGVGPRLLPRRRLRDGRRPGRQPAHQPLDAALRRRSPRQLRRVRRARPAAGVRPRGLRRDAAGPVRVGPEAPGGEPGGCRPRPRLPRLPAAAGDHGTRSAAIATRCGGWRGWA